MIHSYQSSVVSRQPKKEFFRTSYGLGTVDCGLQPEVAG